MKKFITAALAMVLTLGMSVTAFAAASPEKNSVSSATAADGTSVVIDAWTNAITSSELADADAAVAKDVASTSKAIGVASFDVEISAASETNPVTITFAVEGITADDNVIVLHCVNGTWKQENCVVKDGQVLVTVTSCSPFVIYKVVADTTANTSYDGWAGVSAEQKAALMADSLNQNAATAAGATSPKTGDAGVLGFALVAVACGAALVCTKKKFA